MYESQSNPQLAALEAQLRLFAHAARPTKPALTKNTHGQGTPPKTRDLARVHGEKPVRGAKLKTGAAAILQMHAQTAVQGTRFHGNIIGRSMAGRPLHFCDGRGESIHRHNRALLLFEQAACYARGRALLYELVQNLHQLLSEIGGVSQPGQFIGLQGWPGCGTQEFPSGLRAEPRHGTSGTNEAGTGYTNH